MPAAYSIVSFEYEMCYYFSFYTFKFLKTGLIKSNVKTLTPKCYWSGTFNQSQSLNMYILVISFHCYLMLCQQYILQSSSHVPDYMTVYNMLLLENKTGERVTMVIDENDKPLGRETKYSYYDLRNSYTTSLLDIQVFP